MLGIGYRGLQLIGGIHPDRIIRLFSNARDVHYRRGVVHRYQKIPRCALSGVVRHRQYHIVRGDHAGRRSEKLRRSRQVAGSVAEIPRVGQGAVLRIAAAAGGEVHGERSGTVLHALRGHGDRWKVHRAIVAYASDVVGVVLDIAHTTIRPCTDPRDRSQT